MAKKSSKPLLLPPAVPTLPLSNAPAELDFAPHIPATDPTSGPACSACSHWHELAPELGQCRRYPPSIVDPSQLSPFGPVTRFPLTAPDALCGEFTSR